AASNIWLTSYQFDVFGSKEHGLENPVGLSCRLGRTPVDSHPVGSAGINFVFHRNRLVSPMDPAASQRLRGTDPHKRVVVRDPMGVLHGQVVDGFDNICFADAVCTDQNIWAGL